nr:MAG TPA: hypothetical protein [Caudoviricetes sp.]
MISPLLSETTTIIGSRISVAYFIDEDLCTFIEKAYHIQSTYL